MHYLYFLNSNYKVFSKENILREKNYLMEQKYLIVEHNFVKMKQNWIKPGLGVVIQKEALVSTLFSDNVVIITELDRNRLRSVCLLTDVLNMSTPL